VTLIHFLLTIRSFRRLGSLDMGCLIRFRLNLPTIAISPFFEDTDKGQSRNYLPYWPRATSKLKFLRQLSMSTPVWFTDSNGCLSEKNHISLMQKATYCRYCRSSSIVDQSGMPWSFFCVYCIAHLLTGKVGRCYCI